MANFFFQKGTANAKAWDETQVVGCRGGELMAVLWHVAASAAAHAKMREIYHLRDEFLDCESR